MTTQSEAALEEGLIRTLVENSYERVVIKEEDNLRENFKRQLEKHNRKELELHGRYRIYRCRVRSHPASLGRRHSL